MGGHLNILLDYEEPLNIVLDYGGRWVQKVENNRFKAINRECLSCFVFTSLATGLLTMNGLLEMPGPVTACP